MGRGINIKGYGLPFMFCVATMIGLPSQDAWSTDANGAVSTGMPTHRTVQIQDHLERARIYLKAGDYRRAIEACQAQIDAAPSVEHYVYLTYVYHALRGYLDYLAEHDQWLKVGHVYLNMVAEDTLDVVDPPSVLPRMATEMIHEGIRQQSDLSAAMANRLDKNVTDRLWKQQTAWRQSHPDQWWRGIPDEWDW